MRQQFRGRLMPLTRCCSACRFQTERPASAGNRGPTPCTTLYTRKPTPGHHNLGHYVFADGHAGAKTWGFVRQNDFYVFKVDKPLQQYVP